jgi:aromatic ring-cleaving dioxygenase
MYRNFNSNEWHGQILPLYVLNRDCLSVLNKNLPMKTNGFSHYFYYKRM